MTGTADLKENPVLALHLNFFVVQPAGHVHRTKDLQHLFATELRSLLRLRLCFPSMTYWSECRGGLQHRRWCRRGFWLGLGDRLGGENTLGKRFGFFNQSQNFGIAHVLCSRPRSREIFIDPQTNAFKAPLGAKSSSAHKWASSWEETDGTINISGPRHSKRMLQILTIFVGHSRMAVRGRRVDAARVSLARFV